MKSFLKELTPPLILSFIRNSITYKEFLKYKHLTQKNLVFKNMHKGKRCFILGSGPSIKKQNLLPLKNEIVFGLNNFFVHESFEEIFSGEKAKYFITAPIHLPQAEREWVDWFNEMERYVPKNVKMFFGINNYKENSKKLFESFQLFSQHDIYWYFSGRSFNETRFNEKGMDLNEVVFSGEAASIYALIIAIYMGFDEIYLLGMDHDYFLYDNAQYMRMYREAKHQENELERTFRDDFYIQEFLRQYKIFVKYRAFANNSNSKIINASAGGILKVFPKVSFEKLFT